MTPEIATIDDHPYVAALLRPQPFLLDVGLGVGEFALSFLRAYGGRALGLEAVPARAQEAHRRAREHGLDLCTMPWAVWVAYGHMAFGYCPDHPESSSLMPRPELVTERLDVTTVSLASAISTARTLGQGTVDLVKIDIEGAEFAAVESLTTWTARALGATQLSIEMHPELVDGGLEHGIRRAETALRNCGYDIVWHKPNARRPYMLAIDPAYINQDVAAP